MSAYLQDVTDNIMKAIPSWRSYLQCNLHQEHTCKHDTLTPEVPAASMMGVNFLKMALFWSKRGVVVGRAIEF